MKKITRFSNIFQLVNHQLQHDTFKKSKTIHLSFLTAMKEKIREQIKLIQGYD